jgi:hypothetical protein
LQWARGELQQIDRLPDGEGYEQLREAARQLRAQRQGGTAQPGLSSADAQPGAEAVRAFERAQERFDALKAFLERYGADPVDLGVAYERALRRFEPDTPAPAAGRRRAHPAIGGPAAAGSPGAEVEQVVMEGQAYEEPPARPPRPEEPPIRPRIVAEASDQPVDLGQEIVDAEIVDDKVGRGTEQEDDGESIVDATLVGDPSRPELLPGRPERPSEGAMERLKEQFMDRIEAAMQRKEIVVRWELLETIIRSAAVNGLVELGDSEAPDAVRPIEGSAQSEEFVESWREMWDEIEEEGSSLVDEAADELEEISRISDMDTLRRRLAQLREFAEQRDLLRDNTAATSVFRHDLEDLEQRMRPQMQQPSGSGRAGNRRRGDDSRGADSGGRSSDQRRGGRGGQAARGDRVQQSGQSGSRGDRRADQQRGRGGRGPGNRGRGNDRGPGDQAGGEQ